MPQDDARAGSAPKIFRDDCRISWSADTIAVHNHIRGLSPFPGAFTRLGSSLLKVYRSRVCDSGTQSGASSDVSDFTASPAGSLDCSNDRIRVRTGNGCIEILELKLEGRRRMSAQEFLRGNRSLTGSVLL
jgi:methionyl-tRNA formyltransferase